MVIQPAVTVANFRADIQKNHEDSLVFQNHFLSEGHSLR